MAPDGRIYNLVPFDCLEEISKRLPLTKEEMLQIDQVITASYPILSSTQGEKCCLYITLCIESIGKRAFVQNHFVHCGELRHYPENITNRTYSLTHWKLFPKAFGC